MEPTAIVTDALPHRLPGSQLVCTATKFKPNLRRFATNPCCAARAAVFRAMNGLASFRTGKAKSGV